MRASAFYSFMVKLKNRFEFEKSLRAAPFPQSFTLDKNLLDIAVRAVTSVACAVCESNSNEQYDTNYDYRVVILRRGT